MFFMRKLRKNGTLTGKNKSHTMNNLEAHTTSLK